MYTSIFLQCVLEETLCTLIESWPSFKFKRILCSKLEMYARAKSVIPEWYCWLVLLRLAFVYPQWTVPFIRMLLSLTSRFVVGFRSIVCVLVKNSLNCNLLSALLDYYHLYAIAFAWRCALLFFLPLSAAYDVWQVNAFAELALSQYLQ
jgi:hypothetical protein